MAARASQDSIQVLFNYSDATNLRVSQDSIQVLFQYSDVTNLRVSQDAMQVLFKYSDPTNIRVTQSLLQVLRGPPKTPEFMSAGTGASTTSTTISPGLPATRPVGCLLIAWAKCTGAGSPFTWSVDGAWTIFASVNQGSARPLVLAYRYATGSEAAPTFTLSGVNTISAQVFSYTNGAPSGNFFGDLETNSSSGSTTTLTCTAATMTQRYSTAVYVAVASAAPGTPSGWTGRMVSGNTVIADKLMGDSGESTGATSVTVTTANYSVMIFEIKASTQWLDPILFDDSANDIVYQHVAESDSGATLHLLPQVCVPADDVIFDSALADTGRYWRIYGTDNNSSAHEIMALLEVQFNSGTLGYGADITSGKTVTADTEFAGTHVASGAIDDALCDNPATAANVWASTNTAFPHWWSIDFGSSTSITGVTITTRSDVLDGVGGTVNMQAPSAFLIQYSQDNSNWITAKTLSSESFNSYEMKRYLLSSAALFYTGSPHGAHRYWRLKVPADVGGTISSATKIEMRSTPSGSDICTGGTAIESGHTSTFVAANAFDADNSTFFASLASTLDPWIGYDFGSGNAVQVAEVTWRNRQDSNANQAPKVIFVEWSDDNVTWTTAWGTAVQSAWSLSTTRTFTDPNYVSSASLTPGLVTDTDEFFEPLLEQDSGASLVPSLFDDTDEFFEPVISTGAITLVPGIVLDTDTIFSPSAETTFYLTPSHVTDTDVFYQPIVIFDQFLEPTLIVDTDTFFAPTVLGLTTLVPTHITDTDTFHEATILRGPVSLFPGLINEPDVIPTASLDATKTLAPELITDTDQIYFTSVFAGTVLEPSWFIDTDTISTHTIQGGTVTLNPALYIDPDIFWSAFVTRQKKGGQGGGGGGGTVTSNLKYASKLTMTEAGLITQTEFTSATAEAVNTRMMIYADTAGVPTTLLGQTEVKTSIVIGANTYTLAVPVSVINSQVIWVTVHTDSDFDWLLSNAQKGARYNTDIFSDGPSDPFGNSSIDHKQAPVFVIYLESATVTFLPSLVTDTDQIHSPSLATNKTLTAPYIVDEDFTYTDVISLSTSLLPNLFSDSDVVFEPIVGVGAASLLPSLVEDTDTIYQAAMLQDGMIGSANIPSDDQIYESTVTLLGSGSEADLFDDTDTFFTPILLAVTPLEPNLVDADDIFHAPEAIAGDAILLPPLVSAGEDIYPPEVSTISAKFIEPPLVVDEDVFMPPFIAKASFVNKEAILGVLENPNVIRGTRVPTQSITGDTPQGTPIRGLWRDE